MSALPQRWFNLFKYSVYGLLALNVLLFLIDDWQASAHMFSSGIALAEVIEAFAATIDTLAWVILLLLFELETCVLPDEKIRGRVKYSLHGVRALCYLIIVYAFYGYAAKCVSLYGFMPAGVADLCTLSVDMWSYMTDLDEFVILNPSNCQTLSAAELLAMPNGTVVTAPAALSSAQWLAWTDVINAGAWLLVVLVLEIDVRLQHEGLLKGTVLHLSKMIKVVLYTTLLVAAVYWGLEGDFLDFWDAFLWILAFVFIELNVLEWQQETEVGAGEASRPPL